MEKQSTSGTKPAPKGLLQWAMTPPQSYAVYLVALFLVAGLSFYAGSLKPKKSLVPPQTNSQPAPPLN